VTCFELEPEKTASQDSSGFIGGKPLLPSGSSWPVCRMCGDDLVHFIELTLPDQDSEPFQAKSRLQVFACRQHDDIAGTIYSDYGRFESTRLSHQLPSNYWDIHDGHYLIRLLSPATSVMPARAEDRLSLRNLRLLRSGDSLTEPLMSFKLFGYPSWAQDPEEHKCCCGAPMRLLLQIPEGVGFDMESGAPEQPNSFSRKHYCLFLGNELYLLACERQCNPSALLPVLQHT
jgi:hypothetical protein